MSLVPLYSLQLLIFLLEFTGVALVITNIFCIWSSALILFAVIIKIILPQCALPEPQELRRPFTYFFMAMLCSWLLNMLISVLIVCLQFFWFHEALRTTLG